MKWSIIKKKRGPKSMRSKGKGGGETDIETNITQLPVEVLHKIFQSNRLTLADMHRLAQVSHQFYDLINPKQMILQNKVLLAIPYFIKQNNMDINLGRSGICHALSLLWVKYTLDNKIEEFYNLLQKFIAYNDERRTNKDSELADFLIKIDKLQFPEKYDSNKRQIDADKLLNLSYAFQDSSLFTYGDLNNFFNTADLQDKVLTLSVITPSPCDPSIFIGHTVSLAKNAKGYVVYDPSAFYRLEEITNTKELINFLMNVFFKGPPQSKDVLMPFYLTILEKHPNEKNHDMYHNLQELKKQRLIEHNDQKTPAAYGSINPLHWAVYNDDTNAIETLQTINPQINLNERGQNQATPLTLAIARRNISASLLLINMGSSFTEEDGLERNALDITLNLKNGSLLSAMQNKKPY